MTEKDVLQALINITITVIIIVFIVVVLAILLFEPIETRLLLEAKGPFAVLVDVNSVLSSILTTSQTVPLVLAFVPAILGISYPIIIQTISTLNDKYSSTHIVDCFEREEVHLRFIVSLKISVCTSLLTVVIPEAFILMSFASVVYLLFIFFKYVGLLLTYHHAHALLAHLTKKASFKEGVIDPTNPHFQMQEKNIAFLWHPLVDLFRFAIFKNDTKLYFDAKELFLKRVLDFYKKKHSTDTELLSYPQWLLNSSYDIIATGIKYDDENYYKNYEDFAGSVFFDTSYSDESKYRDYHQIVYYAIWRNLRLLIEHNKTNRIVRYWGSAHQHWSFKLRPPEIEYNGDFEETDLSQVRRRSNESSRKKALEFHTVLGAYLMHKSNFQALHDIWFFTQSQPPSYVLVPLNADEIFHLYFKFLDDDFSENNFLIRYSFKDLEFDAMNYVKDVKSVTRRYVCLLLLKQWITFDWHYHYHVQLPQIPESQSEKAVWLSNLNYIKLVVNDLLKDSRLGEGLGINQITHSYCRKHDVPHPFEYLDSLKDRLMSAFQTTLNQAKLSDEKVKRLDSFAVQKIREAHNLLKVASGREVDADGRDSISDRFSTIRGVSFLIDKEALIENVSISHLNYDMLHGQEIFRRYVDHVAHKYLMNTSLRFEVPNGKLFFAVEKLALSSKIHAIVAFNANIEQLKEFMGDEIEKEQSVGHLRFKSIPIYLINGAAPFVNNTFFVLRKDDLPMIRHRDWNDIPDQEEKWQNRWKEMDLIDSELRIYRKVIDLNNKKEFRDKLVTEEGRTEVELKDKVLVDVDFIANCWFRKGVKIVAIKEGDMFKEGGRNDLDKIKPFETLP